MKKQAKNVSHEIYRFIKEMKYANYGFNWDYITHPARVFLLKDNTTVACLPIPCGVMQKIYRRQLTNYTKQFIQNKQLESLIMTSYNSMIQNKEGNGLHTHFQMYIVRMKDNRPHTIDELLNLYEQVSLSNVKVYSNFIQEMLEPILSWYTLQRLIREYNQFGHMPIIAFLSEYATTK